MNGHIGVHSAPGQGALFWINVTLDKEPVEVSDRQEKLNLLQDIRILIVDDSATNREILEHQLASWKTHYQSVATGRQALQLLRDHTRNHCPFDLVILDGMMEEETGLELAHKINHDSEIADNHLILLSSIASDIPSAQLHEAQIKFHLNKPVRQSQLYECLINVLGKVSLSANTAATAKSIAERLQGRILIAEDNDVNLEVALGMLHETGLDINVAKDGQSAVKAYSEAQYDLILMDCHMPGMDGFAATAAIRQQEQEDAHIPIIALTANALEGDREQCLQAGMDDYLSKPFNRDELLQLIQHWLEQVPKSAAEQPSTDNTSIVQAPIDSLAPQAAQRVINTYLDKAPELIAAIHCGLEQHDALAINHAAHSLKSSSANVGAQRLASLCQMLELMGHNNMLSGATEVLDQIEQQFQEVCAALSPSQKRPLAVPASTEKQGLILIVDDDASIRQSVRATLQGAGFEVSEADDGTTAIAVFKQYTPDLVMLDVNMPQMDGYTACTTLRNLESGIHTPILMMTGLEDIASINKAYDAGATDFITKPVNYPLLVYRIRYALRAKQTASALRASQERLVTAQRLAKLGYWQWNKAQDLLQWSEESLVVLNLSQKHQSGTYEQLLSLVHHNDRSRIDTALQGVLRNGQNCSFDHRVLRNDGSECIVHQKIVAESLADGDLNLIGTLQDITELRHAEHKIHHLAYYDSITGLPNRAYLKEHLQQALARARRAKTSVAILFSWVGSIQTGQRIVQP